MKSIAYFITSHGYGHAARAAGVMAAMRQIDPAIRFEIFTTIPQIFFETSVGSNLGYHEVLNDVGLVQDTPTQENVPATLDALGKMYPFDGEMVLQLSETTMLLNCSVAACDISPLGIAVAQKAGIPSILIENFRWNWIYQNYQKFDNRFTTHIHYLRGIFESADYFIQTEPVCVRHNADLTTTPISRLPRTSRTEVRTHLGIQPTDKVIYLSMGGSVWDTSFLKDLEEESKYTFIISGGNMPPQRQGNVLFLDVNSYMPDVLAACDAVICKTGYSTLAEVYYAGIPFGYISRPQFPESQILEEYIESEMQGLKIPEADFFSGEFTHHIDEMLSLPRIERDVSTNGAQTAARFILDIVRSAQ